MTDHQRLQLTMAAQGQISGPLKDWPQLYITLCELLGSSLSGELSSEEVQELARSLLMAEDR